MVQQNIDWDDLLSIKDSPYWVIILWQIEYYVKNILSYSKWKSEHFDSDFNTESLKSFLKFFMVPVILNQSKKTKSSLYFYMDESPIHHFNILAGNQTAWIHWFLRSLHTYLNFSNEEKNIIATFFSDIDTKIHASISRIWTNNRIYPWINWYDNKTIDELITDILTDCEILRSFVFSKLKVLSEFVEKECNNTTI